MNEKLDHFLSKVPDLEKLTSGYLIDYFVYYLTVLESNNAVKASDVEKCFTVSKITKYSNIPSYLSRHSKNERGKKPKFIKTNEGYQLERSYKLVIQKSLKTGPAKTETSQLLRDLLPQLKIKKEQYFLKEAIDCYEIGAKRATIVMVWILTIYHLNEYILENKLEEFNAVLANNADRRVRINKITQIDDFSEIPENKLIEFYRASRIISNDIRKILDTKLGIRNSSAHPSAISISEVKVTDFVIDLVSNVILKYNI